MLAFLGEAYRWSFSDVLVAHVIELSMQLAIF